MGCKVCSKDYCWHCRECGKDVSSLRGGKCENCAAKEMEGHFDCSECGEAYHSSFTSGNTNGRCFTCHFWLEYVKPSPSDISIRIDGHHYMPGLANGMEGYGGRYFEIEMNDGSVFGTHNLWHQGDIPERFRKLYPDNARFLNKD